MTHQQFVNYRVQENIGIIEFDRVDSKVNLVDSETMREFDTILGTIPKDPSLKAVWVMSQKSDIFIAGADIKEIEGITQSQEGEQKSRMGQEILNRLEDLKIPIIAVMDGVALGGGCELALACHYRVATFNDKFKIGLPEVNLGFIPGFAGTYRLPRIVGLAQAFRMILPGRIISGKEALKIGLVDRLFPQKGLEGYLTKFTEEIQKKGRRKISVRKRKFLERLLEDNFIGRAILFQQARKTVLETTKGFYPAPVKALDTLQKTYLSKRSKALAIEAKVFGQLAVTEISKNLVKIFYVTEKYKKLTVPGTEQIQPKIIQKCAVLGAGVMGGGIAQLLSYQGIWVRLKDINYDAIAKGFTAARKIFDQAVGKRKLDKFAVDDKMAHITGTLDYSGFKSADMVIEAVVENMEIKKKVFGELSQIVSPETILCTNTSALSVTQMARATKDPSKVIGLHFFNPVHRMPLLEIITTDLTSKETLATTLQLAKRLGKTPIVVKDSCGFLVNRILLSYINEAGRILEEGARIEDIDRIVTDFGFPMGPLTLSDEVGLDVGLKVLLILEEAFGQQFRPVDTFRRIYEQKLFGKKTREGFYVHQKKRIPNRKVYALITSKEKKSANPGEYLRRMIYIMINEASRCLAEGIVDSPEAVDVGMIMGCGFPPFRGGLLRYADSVGIAKIVSQLEDLAGRLGDGRFKPSEYLVGLTKANRKFFA